MAMNSNRWLLGNAIVLVVICSSVVVIVMKQASDGKESSLRRRLSILDPRTVKKKTKDRQQTTSVDNFAYNLPASAAEWCTPSIHEPLDYESYCADNPTVNLIRPYGGATNSLKLILLGTIQSYEEGKCFVIDESESHLILRSDQSQVLPTFFGRYFEPIGLPMDSEKVQKARETGKLVERDWMEFWNWEHERRVEGQVDAFPYLGYGEVEGHALKRLMLRRMWRPLPAVREAACRGLETHLEDAPTDDFMVMSLRKGDKESKENFQFATNEQYLEAAHAAIRDQFDGTVPIIFVATDDCTPYFELRSLRPHWRWKSQCDFMEEADSGFALVDMKDWSMEQTDKHFEKFFLELFAMATAKYFIGVVYTNISWWAYFMRPLDKSTFHIIRTPGTELREPVELW